MNRGSCASTKLATNMVASRYPRAVEKQLLSTQRRCVLGVGTACLAATRRENCVQMTLANPQDISAVTV